ncbi:MAG: CDP-alcohol phosphatidyltransferase family protein [Clostridia bacterium]|nr:CDP-alcohol phosphatidyltransferase family protein [Clostridia bacterium]
MFIGYYSLANAVTLFGLISSVTACFLAANGNFKLALYMLFLACLCDSFDGKIARATKRTPQQKYYGVQLDSLCDVISFGLTPCFIAFSFGFKGWLDVLIYGIFIVCGAIRLAYFNTLANENPGKPMKTFKGVPIPISTMVITLLFLFTTFLPASITVWIFRIALFALAIGFILNIKIKKPTLKRGAILLLIEIVLLLILVIAGDCQAPIIEGTYQLL